MSSGLSSSCETAVMLAQDYGGRVQVVNNQRISVTLRQSALDAQALAAAGRSAAEIKALLEQTKFDSDIYITVDTLKYLKKGGQLQLPPWHRHGAQPQAGAAHQGREAGLLCQGPGLEGLKKTMLDTAHGDGDRDFRAAAAGRRTLHIAAAFTGM